MKIALIGYGKMGHLLEEVALSRGHEVVSIIDVDNRADFDSEAFRSADVAIEFTAPTVAFDNVREAFAKGVKVVSGTTGWYGGHEAELHSLCTEGGSTLFWSSNYSVGVALFRAVNRQLARLMNGCPGYTVRMEETHHIHKLDAPSGTAVTIADDIRAELKRAGSVPITSIREGEVPGIHTVCYESEADVITLTHSAKNRTGFALGAVLAAEFTARQHGGIFGIDDLFPWLK
ncbi:MAG: 4-hydroxy-tetrahydrodipicolinate reductase [Bacteroidaceae bacterium]|nr:4-hydroxy-tetrahydrodipicolinate reductase [Bacteroidaceae bacterium]